MNNKSMIYLIFTIFQNCFHIKISQVFYNIIGNIFFLYMGRSLPIGEIVIIPLYLS